MLAQQNPHKCVCSLHVCSHCINKYWKLKEALLKRSKQQLCTEYLWPVCFPQSFWATSLDRKGYSGVATYVRLQHAALDAQTDCLELGDEGEGLDREGRYVSTSFPSEAIKHSVTVACRLLSW